MKTKRKRTIEWSTIGQKKKKKLDKDRYNVFFQFKDETIKDYGFLRTSEYDGTIFMALKNKYISMIRKLNPNERFSISQNENLFVDLKGYHRKDLLKNSKQKENKNDYFSI